jgi:hypothetical protein
MSRKSKREIERELETLGDGVNSSRSELVAGLFMWSGDEPELTEYLVSRGFAVEREERTHDNGYRDVLLHPTPDVKDVFLSVTWHYDGPTTPNDAVRIRWDDEALEKAVKTAEHPVEYDSPTLPADPVTVAEGEGWAAVAEADMVAENMVDRRSKAEREGLEILGDAPPVSDREKHDLVEIDGDPVPYAER